MARRPKSITPALQFMVVCEAIERDQDGNVSFRRIFDKVSANVPANVVAQLKFSVAVQFRGGTGEHKHWVKVLGPEMDERTTDETSFWLANTHASHRHDHRITMDIGPQASGRYELVAVLDGRDVLSVPLTVDLRVGPPLPLPPGMK